MSLDSQMERKSSIQDLKRFGVSALEEPVQSMDNLSTEQSTATCVDGSKYLLTPGTVGIVRLVACLMYSYLILTTHATAAGYGRQEERREPRSRPRWVNIVTIAADRVGCQDVTTESSIRNSRNVPDPDGKEPNGSTFAYSLQPDEPGDTFRNLKSLEWASCLSG